MATPELIAALRLLIAEPDSTGTYTDAVLDAILDTMSGDLNKSAYEVWIQKAAAASDLVDISEGGSSRKMGDLQDNALKMAAHFASATPGGVEPDAPKYTRLHKLARP